mgnify:FL=1
MSHKLTYESFIEAFPEFSDDVAWPVTRVQSRIDLSNCFVRVRDDLCDSAANHIKGLYVAHYLAAQGPSSESGKLVQSAGGTGIVSSKSVDGASVSFDTSTGAEQGAGFWNVTVYGREYWQLIQMMGAGGVQI